MTQLVQLTAWSFSRWETWEECPLKAKLKFIDKIPEPASPALDRGTDVHNTLAAYLRGDLPFNDPVPGWTYWEKLLKQLRNMEPMVELEWAYTKDWQTTDWFGKSKPVWFRSKLDAGKVYDDNTADVVDFKTGKPRPPKAQQQGETYAISMFTRYPALRQLNIRFWYVDLQQEGKELVFSYSRDMLPDLLKTWNSRGERVTKDTTFVPRPGTHCGFCPFAKSKGGPCKYG